MLARKLILLSRSLSPEMKAFVAVAPLANPWPLDKFVRTVKGAGWLADRDALYMLCEATQTAGRTNIVAPSGPQLVSTNGPKHVPGWGFIGDSVGCDFDTQLDLSAGGRKISQNDAGQMVFMMTVKQTGAFDFGSDTLCMGPVSTTGPGNFFSRSSSGSSDGTAVTKNLRGMYATARSLSASYLKYQGATSLGSITRTSAALGTTTPRVFRRTGGSVVVTSPNQLAMLSIGKCPTPAQVAVVEQAMRDYLTTKGTWA